MKVEMLTQGRWAGSVKVEKSPLEKKDWQLVAKRTSVEDLNVSFVEDSADGEMVKITCILKKGDFNAVLSAK